MRQRGFLQFLLGNPLLLLSAALGIGLVVTGLVAKGYKERVIHWRTQYESVQAQFGAFRMQVAAAGEKAKAEAEAKERKQAEVNHAVVADYEMRLARLRSEYQRLRERPVRPDLSPVPITACGPTSPDGAATESVPLAEYRSLEARAAEDALKVLAWQNWAKSQNLAVE